MPPRSCPGRYVRSGATLSQVVSLGTETHTVALYLLFICSVALAGLCSVLHAMQTPRTALQHSPQYLFCNTFTSKQSALRVEFIPRLEVCPSTLLFSYPGGFHAPSRKARPRRLATPGSVIDSGPRHRGGELGHGRHGRQGRCLPGVHRSGGTAGQAVGRPGTIDRTHPDILRPQQQQDLPSRQVGGCYGGM